MHVYVGIIYVDDDDQVARVIVATPLSSFVNVGYCIIYMHMASPGRS